MTASRRDWLLDVGARAGVEAAYLAVGLATSVLALAVWIVGVTATLSLVVFVVGLPVFLLSAMAFRWTAELDRRNAALVLGRPLHGRYRDHKGEPFLARLASTARDRQTWKDLAWLVTHSTVGLVFGAVAVGAVLQVVAVWLMPFWFWTIPDGVDWGLWNVDTLGEALLMMPLAIPLAAIAVVLLRLMSAGESKLATALLDSPGDVAAERPLRPPPDLSALLTPQALVSGFLALLTTLIWAFTGGYFWPVWVWLGLALPLALTLGIRRARREPPGFQRRFAVQLAISAVLGGTTIIVWLLAGRGTFWPVWTLLGLGTLLGVHWLVAMMWVRVFPGVREQELVERVDELTRTRRGALDVQDAELRRIERDLHDGAQARLVALSMQLGRAEENLSGQPEVAELVRQARDEASAAIAELRDLSRGIAPPVLADRGLAAAVEALGRRSAIPVSVDVELDRRPPGVLETAAYFVAAEALTNVAKHAPDSHALVTIAMDRGRLVVEVADDGPGGADPAGGGLMGLRGRVEALDGDLRVMSPAGAGTTIRAELPCES
ncbi:MAG TPA: sensor domain-containing protein [Thermoleophilaceae bacterium]